MKKAVIVVGEHYAGKSRTINQFLKPLIGISKNHQRFRIGQHDGTVLSQSLEERSGNGHVFSQSLEEKGLVDVGGMVAKYQHYERLVFAARPNNESYSLYGRLKSELESHGFSVSTVNVVRNQQDSFYAERAQEILQQLQ
jgi:hypothetical protein